MGLPFLSVGLSQHHYSRGEHLSCWPRPHKYHIGLRYPLYSKGSTTMGAWSLDPLVLSHIASPGSCQPDKAMGWPFEGATEVPAQRWYYVRMGHPLQNVIYTPSQCTLHGAESPQADCIVSEKNGWKQEWHHLPSLTVTHLWEFVIPAPELCRFRDTGSQRRKASIRWHSKNHVKL